MQLLDYEQETVSMIRKLDTAVKYLNDEKVVELYREWSSEIACATWLAPSERGVEQFCEWATAAPCDRA